MKDFMMIFIGADYGDIGLSPEEMQVRVLVVTSCWRDEVILGTPAQLL